MTARIPSEITQDEFNEAMKPLFDRLGVSAMEVTGDIHIVALKNEFTPYEIRFSVVATPDSDAPFPDAVQAEGHPQGDQFAIWTHNINVGVLP